MDGTAIGTMLAGWRRSRRMSQLALALEAGTSARHVSFVETGRARPSRQMVLTLSSALQVPLRERNALLFAAGFAPVFRETPLDAPEMAEMLAALRLMLRRNEPFGAVAFDRSWDIVMANTPYAAFVEAALPEGSQPVPALTLIPPPRPNLLRLLCETEGFRAGIANWEAVVAEVLGRVAREVARETDAGRRALLGEILALPGLPRPAAEPGGAGPFVIPVELRTDRGPVRLLSTIATLGTAQDITLQELRIETFHPADEDSLATGMAVARAA